MAIRTPGGVLVARLLTAFIILAAPSCQTPTEPDLEEEEQPPIEQPLPLPVSMQVTGYHAWWTGNAWQQYEWERLDALYFFDIEIQGDGSLGERNGWPFAWNDLIDAASAAEVPIVPVVTILDTGTFESVFSDSAHIGTLTEALLDLTGSGSIGGLHLDVEVFDPVAAPIRERWSLFVESLGSQMKAARPELEYSLFALAEDPADVFDEARLARAVDYLVVQGYDLHWQSGDRAGPVAALSGWDGRNWTAIVDRYRRLGVSPAKMVMAMPFYGYEWPTESDSLGSRTRGAARQLAYSPGTTALPSAPERAEQYGKRRDESSGSPYYVYEDSTGWNQGWYEDATSLAAKAEFLSNEGLRGAAVFPLGYGTQDLFGSVLGPKGRSVQPLPGLTPLSAFDDD